MEAVVCDSMLSDSTPFCLHIFSYKRSFQWAINLVGDLWLLYYLFRFLAHWDSSPISWLCPVSWRSCSFGSAISVPVHSPAVHRLTWCLGGSSQKPWIWASVVDESAYPLSCTHITREHSPALPWLGHPMQQPTRGRSSSPTHMSWSLLTCPHTDTNGDSITVLTQWVLASSPKCYSLWGQVQTLQLSCYPGTSSSVCSRCWGTHWGAALPHPHHCTPDDGQCQLSRVWWQDKVWYRKKQSKLLSMTYWDHSNIRKKCQSSQFFLTSLLIFFIISHFIKENRVISHTIYPDYSLPSFYSSQFLPTFPPIWIHSTFVSH
jgi:hypothetical protein